jgi:hypothetical protein
MTPAGEKREKRRERKGLAPLPIWEKGGGERGDSAEGEEGSASSSWRLARGVAGSGGDDGERIGAERRHR